MVLLAPGHWSVGSLLLAPCRPRGQGCSSLGGLGVLGLQGTSRMQVQQDGILQTHVPAVCPHNRATSLPWGAGGVVTGAVQSLPARTIPGFCGSAVTGTVLLSSLQGHRSWPSSQALTCRGRQGAIERHGKGQCSLHSAFVGSQVKPDVCI